MITICFTYFKSLTLANLAAALYSVRRQDFARVKEVVIVDNDTEDSAHEIRTIVDALAFPVPVRILSFKHGDVTKTHSWSANKAIKEATTPWIFFTRADYLLDFSIIQKFVQRTPNWNGFITSNGCHLGQDIGQCEHTNWRIDGPGIFRGVDFDYTLIDSGVWMARKSAIDYIGGLDERFSVWGHAQTDFQHRLYQSGVEFVRVPERLFFHPLHEAPRNITLANQELSARGASLREMWQRYHGVNPY
jgi:GT2 family glycosyltransferase